MTIVRLAMLDVRLAIMTAARTFHFYDASHRGGFNAALDSAACSPAGAVVRRAVTPQTSITDAYWLCRHNIRGGDYTPNSDGLTDAAYAERRQAWMRDLADGVQPLLVVERAFRLTLGYGYAVSMRDPLYNAFITACTMLYAYAYPFDIDIRGCQPRDTREVVE